MPKETIFKYQGAEVKIVDKSTQEEKQERLENALKRFMYEVERERKECVQK